jgi:hypothetical protein
MNKLLLLCAIIFVAMAGCGSSDGTSGSLSLADPTVDSTKSIVSVTATYTPASGKTLISGQEVNFTWWTIGATSKTQSPSVTANGSIDGSGSARSQLTLPLDRTESLNVFVNAKIGGVSSDTKSIQVAP